MKTIEITISPKGETKVETRGFAGAECREASKFVAQALGTRTAELRASGVVTDGRRAGAVSRRR